VQSGFGAGAGLAEFSFCWSAAALLLQSLLNVRTSSPGFTTRGVQITAVDLISAGYDRTRRGHFKSIAGRVKTLPAWSRRSLRE